MKSRLFRQKGWTAVTLVIVSVLLATLVIGCGTPEPTPVPTEAVQEAPTQPVEEPAPAERESATLAIEHFSIIEGTTWSGAHDRAGKRIA